MKKVKLPVLLSIALIFLLAIPVGAQDAPLPDVIPLPEGFRPEGIAVGEGSTFYTGSLANGAIYRGDLTTGEGAIFVEGQEGMVSVGMDYDENTGRLFVAGGATGMARVFDGATGELLATYQLADGQFINDVIVTEKAAYFTNSNAPMLHVVPFGEDGALPDQDGVTTLPLTHDWEQVEGFNANGIEWIEAMGGDFLIVVNSTVGKIYRVDPETGRARAIRVRDQTFTMGDGLLVRDNDFVYVVRNRANEIIGVNLTQNVNKGRVEAVITNPNFDVPTTIGWYGGSLYAVNAKFRAQGEPVPTEFEIVRVPLEDVDD